MELPNKILDQMAFDIRPKIEHILVVMTKSTHEEHLSQSLQIINKQFKKTVTSLSGFDGIFKIKNTINSVQFKKSITDVDDFIQITILLGAYEIEGLNK